MPALAQSVVTSTLDRVKVVYVDRATSKWWNAKRDKDEPVTFCGWYWLRGREESGPFKSRSSALRDAYYITVLKQEVPTIARSALSPPKALRLLSPGNQPPAFVW